jgi:hypothetical protein
MIAWSAQVVFDACVLVLLAILLWRTRGRE